ncbi:MAG TPA: hypothetical protein VHE10_02520 [Candidatus Paceibacterota bacterium]|nr:hypothetical protein [Candidatus Paceibacterota bacterium]
MENNKQSSEVKTKNITFGLVFGWILGVIFVILGITNIAIHPVSGILFILTALIALPPMNKLLRDKAHVNLSKGLRVIIVLILMISGFAFIGSSAVKEAETNTVADASNTAPAPTPVPTIKISADKIMDDYTANEVAADAKYKNNVVSVTGIVDSIGKDIVDTPYIALKTGGQYSISVVQCMFPRSAESILANISKGEYMTLQGKVTGKLGNIILSGCSIAK